MWPTQQASGYADPGGLYSHSLKEQLLIPAQENGNSHGLDIERYGNSYYSNHQYYFGTPVSINEIEQAQEADNVEMTEYQKPFEPGKIKSNTLDDNETIRLSGLQFKLMHLTILLAFVLVGYDNSNIANIQISIYTALGNLELLPWVVGAASLGNAGIAPLARRLMDLVDQKWFLLASLAFSAAGGAATGAAQDIPTVIAGRILTGIGACGTYLSFILYMRLFTNSVEYVRIIGVSGIGYSVGLIGGPLVGGAFAENYHTTWRWASYIQIPASVLVMFLCLLWVPWAPPARGGTLLRSLCEIDWVGAALHIASLVLFVAALLFSGSIWAWNSGSSIAMWVCFVVTTTVYILQQTFCWLTTPENRIFPVSVLRSWTAILALVGVCCSMAAYAITLYYLPLYFAFAHGDNPIQGGVHMLPFLCVDIVFTILAGALLPRVRYYAAVFFVGGLIITAGSGAMMAVDLTTPTSVVMGITSLIGAGVGLTFQLANATLGVLLPAALRKDGYVALNQAQYAAVTITVSLAGCVFQNQGFNRLKGVFGPLGYSDTDIRDALAGLKSALLHTDNPQITVEATSIITSEIIGLFYFVVAGGLLMIVCACKMKWEPLDFGPTETESKKIDEALDE